MTESTNPTLQRIADFFTTGKFIDRKNYLPEEVASKMAEIETAMQTGLQAKHLASGAIRLLPFDGVDGSGESPDLTCPFTGALEGDSVIAVLDTSDFSDARSKFESTITANGYIEQTSLADESTKTFVALLFG